MQRLYPVLLSISIALAVAIFLRPRLAEDLTALAVSAWSSLGSAAQAAIGSGDSSTGDTRGPVNSSYAAPATYPVAGATGNTAASDMPVYPSTDVGPVHTLPSAPAWQQGSIPPAPQNSMPAEQQNSAPSWQQNPNVVRPPEPNWNGPSNGEQTNMPPGVSPGANGWNLPPNSTPPNLAPGDSPGGSGWNLPSNGGPANWPGPSSAPSPAAPVWKIPEMPPPADQSSSQNQAFGPPPPQEPSFVARSLPPAGPAVSQNEMDRSRMASNDDARGVSGDPQPVAAAMPPAGPPLGAPQTRGAAQIPPEAELFERGQIVGRVGNEVILYGEIGLGVPEIRAQYKDRMSPAELEKQIETMLKSRLKPHIETKLLYLDVKRTIPPEALKGFEKRIGDEFERSQVDVIMKSMKASSRQELEEKLRAWNSSLEQQKRVFVEQMLAHQWLKQQVKVDEEVTYEQMLAYYRDHVGDYEHPARARWQQLMVRFSRMPDKAGAYRAIAEMGNQVLGGKDFAEAAKNGSDGPTARNGGTRDWTTQGSLVSEALDRAVFTLPVGQLSPILEDEQGFHIICVLERKEAYRTPFDEAQAEIRKKVREGQGKDQEQAYLAKLWGKTPVWTIFDGTPGETRVSSRPQPPTGAPSPNSRAGWPR